MANNKTGANKINAITDVSAFQSWRQIGKFRIEKCGGCVLSVYELEDDSFIFAGKIREIKNESLESLFSRCEDLTAD